jgi:hypothetical protein
VVRIPHPERLKDRVISESSDDLQKFNSKDGLSADACSFVLEDREGNIWVATRMDSTSSAIPHSSRLLCQHRYFESGSRPPAVETSG